MSVDEIVAQATTFLLAGADTILHTLSFALYSLAINPEVQSKLKREIGYCVEQSSVSFSWCISINTPGDGICTCTQMCSMSCLQGALV